MASNFPSTITAYTNPLPTDKLNAPSHSGIETNQNSGLTALETFIGTTSSIQGTLMYDIRATASDGGGHVQTANKGGTGQTSYTKGDLLIATSSSVLTKLSVGVDGQALVANSSVAAGINWAQTQGTKLGNSASIFTLVGTNAALNASILSVMVPGSTLGTTGAVRATAFISAFRILDASPITVRAWYGGDQIASVTAAPTGALNASIAGEIRYNLIANNSATAQRGILEVDWAAPQVNPLTSIMAIKLYNQNTTSIASSANRTIGITVAMEGNNAFRVDGSTVERIN